MATLVADVMTRAVISVRNNAEYKDMLQVSEDDLGGKLVGIVARSDILRVCDRADDDIRREIEEQVIRASFSLDNLAFNVTITGGVVTLAGPVEREPVALSLLQAVRQVDGVVAVREMLSYPRP